MKKRKIPKVILVSIFIIFLYSYIVSKNGYYEYSLNSKKNLTEEEIKQFEQDLKEGKEVDIKDYLNSNKVDYTNKLTRTTVKVSTKINSILKSGIDKIFGLLNKLVES